MRELMIGRLKGYGWLSPYFKRGDSKARTFATYEDWLSSLSDEDLLSEYDTMVSLINHLD